MNFEGGFLLLLGVIFAAPLLLWLPHLVNRLAGRRLISPWLPVALLIAAPVAVSFYLDTAGEIRPATVINKKETVKVDYDGTWTRRLWVQLGHEERNPSLTPHIWLLLDAATYDALRVGQRVELRLVEIYPIFRFGRLKEHSTFSLIARLLPKQPRGPWRQATATVKTVTRVTHHSTEDNDEMRWPYDAVRLSFTPAGRTEPVEVVDVIETASAPNLIEGGAAQITWPEDDPRSARIVGTRPGAPWANWFYHMGEGLAIGAVLIAFLAVLGFIRRLRKRAKTQDQAG